MALLSPERGLFYLGCQLTPVSLEYLQVLETPNQRFPAFPLDVDFLCHFGRVARELKNSPSGLRPWAALVAVSKYLATFVGRVVFHNRQKEHPK
jgi:hypothetical protein